MTKLNSAEAKKYLLQNVGLRLLGSNGATYQCFFGQFTVKYKDDDCNKFADEKAFQDVTFREWSEIYFDKIDDLRGVNQAFFKGVMVEKNFEGNWEHMGCNPENIRDRYSDNELLTLDNWRKITW